MYLVFSNGKKMNIFNDKITTVSNSYIIQEDIYTVRVVIGSNPIQSNGIFFFHVCACVCVSITIRVYIYLR